jgi:hypothetical protein
MLGEKMKVARGTARKFRRMSMDVFRQEQSRRAKAAADAVTITYNLAGHRGTHRELNQHLHDVATITDLRNGLFVVRRYQSTPDYPANVPAPHRKLLFRYPVVTKNKAVTDAERINAIEVR